MIAFSVFSMLSLCVFFLCALSFYLFIKRFIFFDWSKVDFQWFIHLCSTAKRWFYGFYFKINWYGVAVSWTQGLMHAEHVYYLWAILLLPIFVILDLGLLVRFCLCQPCFAIHNTFLKCNISVGEDCCFQTVSYFLAAYHFCTLSSCLEYSFLFLNSFL